MSAIRKYEKPMILSMNDFSEYEEMIRQDERERIKEQMRARRAKIEAKKAAKRALMFKFFRQKLAGAAFLLLSYIILTSDAFTDPYTGLQDGTALFITVPMGLFLLFTKDLCFMND